MGPSTWLVLNRSDLRLFWADPSPSQKELQARGKRQLECSVLSALWENLEIEAEQQRGEGD
jgi:hypothetical protein